MVLRMPVRISKAGVSSRALPHMNSSSPTIRKKYPFGDLKLRYICPRPRTPTKPGMMVRIIRRE